MHRHDNKLTAAQIDGFSPSVFDVGYWREFIAICLRCKITVEDRCKRRKRSGREVGGTPCRNEALEVAMATLRYMGCGIPPSARTLPLGAF